MNQSNGHTENTDLRKPGEIAYFDGVKGTDFNCGHTA